MKKKTKIKVLVIVVLLTLGGVYWFFKPTEGRGSESSKWITAEVKSGRISQSITATGTIEPVTSVDVGTQVSGILTSLYVDYNSIVKKGQVIAELDKSTLTLTYNSSKNDVQAAKSKFDYEQANFNRVKALYDEELIADSEYEQALFDFETSKNNYEIAKNNLKRAETNLGYATIYSPIDGVVLSRSVEEGQTVASSFNTPTLFTIAADLKDMQVIADVDEADIGNVVVGQKAEFSVDAFPGHIFKGEITQVRQNGTVESNVVTYEVVISASNPDLKLKPGLTANIEIFVLDERVEALVPVAALSFNPPMRTNSEKGVNSLGSKKPNQRKVQNSNKNRIWIVEDDSLKPIKVDVGISNGISTEIKGVNAGTQVVIGAEEISEAKRPKNDNMGENPFVQKRTKGKK